MADNYWEVHWRHPKYDQPMLEREARPRTTTEIERVTCTDCQEFMKPPPRPAFLNPQQFPETP